MTDEPLWVSELRAVVSRDDVFDRSIREALESLEGSLPESPRFSELLRYVKGLVEDDEAVACVHRGILWVERGYSLAAWPGPHLSRQINPPAKEVVYGLMNAIRSYLMPGAAYIVYTGRQLRHVILMAVRASYGSLYTGEYSACTKHVVLLLAGKIDATTEQ